MKQYKELCQRILDEGVQKGDRTGTGTKSVFGHQMRFDMADGFPAVTTKKLAWKGVVSELLWFLTGSTDERYLAEILHGVNSAGKRTIWTDNFENQGVALGYEDGELGPVYGNQWRTWGGRGFDQILDIIKSIETDPNSRRHMVSAWNVEDIDKMALPPCHVMFQCYVADGKLSMHMYQRSADVFLGIPFNIASYALLLHILAFSTNLIPGELIMSLGDAHIYNNHADQVKTVLGREEYKLPLLHMDASWDWLKYMVNSESQQIPVTIGDFRLIDYKHHDPVKGKMAI